MIEKLQHKGIGEGEQHIIHNLKFTTMGERDLYVPLEEDLYKVCLVLNPYGYFSLSGINPIKWESMGASESGGSSGGFDFIENSDPLTTSNKELSQSWLNAISGEIFICTDETPNSNIWRGTNRTIIEPKRIYPFDIFGDNSAVAFLQLDDDITDMGGAYNIAIENTTYEVGKIGKCIKSNNDSAKLDIVGKMRTVSFFAFFPSSVTKYGYFFDCRGWGTEQYCYMNANVSIASVNIAKIYQNKTQVLNGSPFTKGGWVHVVIDFNGEVNGVRLLNNNAPIYGLTNVKIDHVRAFKRALTTTEMNTLMNEVQL